jgi:hypothetical protein
LEHEVVDIDKLAGPLTNAERARRLQARDEY